jgi:hypothetical protein
VCAYSAERVLPYYRRYYERRPRELRPRGRDSADIPRELNHHAVLTDTSLTLRVSEQDPACDAVSNKERV